MAYDWVTPDLISRFLDQPKNNIFAAGSEFDFVWWFHYFWKEVGRHEGGERLKEVIGRALEAARPVETRGISARTHAEQKAAGKAMAELPDLLPLTSAPADNNVRLTLLNLLLDIGFSVMPSIRVTDPAQGASLFAQRILGQTGAAIAYRGEGRDFATVLLHHGAQNRVDLRQQAALKSMNMTQPWHPFSRREVADRMYARKGSGDNCLYTVTSVAGDVAVAVGFPLIEDHNIYPLNPWTPRETPASVRHLASAWVQPRALPAQTLRDWTYGDYAAARAKGNVYLVRAAITGLEDQQKRSGIFLATESYLYAVKVTEGVNTEQFIGGQCHERGVRGVALRDFLAGAKLRRVHLGPNRTVGVTAFVQEVKYFMDGRWVAGALPEGIARAHFQGDQLAGLQALGFMSNSGFWRNCVIEGEAPDRPPPTREEPNYSVTGIEQWDLSFDQFASQRTHQGNTLYFARVQ